MFYKNTKTLILLHVIKNHKIPKSGYLSSTTVLKPLKISFLGLFITIN